jgi:tetratricopeptide (TPR) repeat protein
MNGVRHVSLAIALSGSLAGVAGAQASKCKVNEGGPFQLTSARIYLNKASEANSKADERPKHLKNAVQVLTDNPDKIGNQVGRNMLLGKVLYFWTREKGISQTPTRGSLGYSTNPNAPIDIYAAIDTAFDAVELAIPACADSLDIFRRHLGVATLNSAVELINANATDSAEVLVKRSLVIYPNSVNAYNALAVIAGKKQDTTAMATYSRKIIETAKGDTAAQVVKMRQAATYNLAINLINQAEAGPEANKKARLDEAKTLLQAYLAEIPGDPNAQQALARIGTTSGDTAAVSSIYNDMLANPAKYTDIQLFEAGSALSFAKKYPEASRMFEAGLAANPYYRDALFNLATVYYESKEYGKMAAVTHRLVQIDPNNPDNWRQMAAAYQGLMRTAKDAKAKKAAQDTLLKFLSKSDSMPVRVSFSEFRHSGSKHTLRGSVENRGKATGNYTLKVEFVDKSGNVVATQEAVVGPVNPKETKPFTVEVNQSGIVAFRYAPIA